MRNAKDIKHLEAYVGMNFIYTNYKGIDYPCEVIEVKVTKAGRIKVFIYGENVSKGGALSHNPVAPTTTLQSH